MKHRKSNNVDIFLIVGLLFFGTVCFSEDSMYSEQDENFIPTWIRAISSSFRWILMCGISIYTLLKLKYYKSYLKKTQILIILFYFILAFWSIFDGDIIRYVGMTLFAIFIPLYIADSIYKHGVEKILKYVVLTSAVLVILGFFVTILMNGSLFARRYTGFYANPNQFVGMNIFLFLSLLSVYIYGYKGTRLAKSILLFILIISCITQFISASRNGLLCMFASIFFIFICHIFTKKQIYFLIIALFIVLYIFIQNESESMNRIWDVETAVDDTGRARLWEKGFYWINKSPWLGWGTNARGPLLARNNAHSMYVALLLFSGYIVGSLLILIFILSCINSFFIIKRINNKYKKVFVIYSAYMLSLIVYSIGEDAPLGIGAPWFIYLLFSLGIQNGISSLNKQLYIKNIQTPLLYHKK